MSSIITPRRVFLDTNHLINLAKVRSGKTPGLCGYTNRQITAYECLLDHFRQGSMIPCIAFWQPYEWLSATDNSAALEIAEILDLAYDCLQAAPLQIALVLEVLQDLKRLHTRKDWNIPGIVHAALREPPWLTFIVEETDSGKEEWRKIGLVGTRIRERSMREYVCTISKPHQMHGHRHNAPSSSFEAAFFDSKAADALEQSQPLEAAFQRVARSAMLVEFLARHFPGESAIELIRNVDTMKCPALRTWHEFWRRYVRGKSKPNRTDHNDVLFYPAHVYSDYSLTEHQMAHFLRETCSVFRERVFSDPVDLVQRI